MSPSPPFPATHSNLSRAKHLSLRLRVVVSALWLILCLALSLAGCGGHQAGLAGTPVANSTPAITATTTEANTASSLPSATKTWIPLSGTSDAAILAAVRQSPFFHMVTSAPPGSDGYTDLSHLGAPVLVLAFGKDKEGDSVSASDYYEIPARSADGMVEALISAELNSTHTAIYVGSLSGYGPTPTWPGHLVTAGQAVQIVQNQRHVGLRSGTYAQLIYLAAFNTTAEETGQINWQAGGAGPQNPIWLVPGADRQTYFVGTDAQSYTLGQLPLQ